MANINDILNDARIKGCSDVHIGENTGITLRQDGKLIEFEQTFSNEEIKEMISESVEEERSRNRVSSREFMSGSGEGDDMEDLDDDI